MKSRILIVDDTPDNLRLLEGILAGAGHDVRAATSGEVALKAAKSAAPDLILLDITMPDMDGFEVCRRLKEAPETSEIPVLFISARPDMDAKLEAFEKGGQDYVTKPFACGEVLARVNTHLRLFQMKRELREKCERLQEMEVLKDNLVHMIVHDMRSPLMGIYGNLSLLKNYAASRFSKKIMDCVNSAFEASSMLNEMASSLLDVSRLESNQMPLSPESADLRKIAGDAVSSLGALMKKCEANINAAGPVMARCDIGITERIIMNLVGNAVKFSPKDGVVKIELSAKNGMASVTVRDSGPGIPPEFHSKIFDKFGQVELRKENKKYSTGLGLTFCKLAVEAQGGQIGVDSEVGKGSAFRFTLPPA